MLNRIAACALLLPCAVTLARAQNASPEFADASFETPSLGACPAADNAVSGLSGTPWNFVEYAGITTGGCGLLLNAPSPPAGGGTQMAFIQGGPSQDPQVLTSSLSQTVSGFLTGHRYTITLYAAGRPPGAGCNDNCTELNLSVLVGNTDILDIVNPPTAAFQQYTSQPFAASGSATITITGTAPAGSDETSFVDLLSIQDLGAGSPPSVGAGGVVSASAFGEFTIISPGSWIEIYGANLAVDTRGWTGADFTGINAPTSLDGTSVTIGGQKAFIDYISPGQVNALVPFTVATGTQQLTVTSPGGTSAAVNITVNAVEPGLLAPSNFSIGGTQYVVALFADNSYVLPIGALNGLTSRPAKPGDIIVLYGIGFGPVSPAIPAGQLVGEANTLADDFQISIGGVPCQIQYDGLAPNYTGLYQFNIAVPNVAAGNQPLTFTVDGVNGSQTLYVAIGN